jgi:hypothetical protein
MYGVPVKVSAALPTEMAGPDVQVGRSLLVKHVRKKASVDFLTHARSEPSERQIYSVYPISDLRRRCFNYYATDHSVLCTNTGIPEWRQCWYLLVS